MIFHLKIFFLLIRFKSKTESFIKNIDIEKELEKVITDTLNINKVNRQLDAIGNYFNPLYGYYRGLYSKINEESWVQLRYLMEKYDDPAVKPKYQIKFRLILINELVAIHKDISGKVRDIMNKFGMENNPAEHYEWIQKSFLNCFDDARQTSMGKITSVFEHHNKIMKPFQDRKISIVALAIAIGGIILTIILNFNQLWNFVFRK